MTHRHYLIKTTSATYHATHLEWRDRAIKFWGADETGRQQVVSVPYHRLRVVEEIDRRVLPRRRRPRRPVTGKRLMASEFEARRDRSKSRSAKVSTRQSSAHMPQLPQPSSTNTAPRWDGQDAGEGERVKSSPANDMLKAGEKRSRRNGRFTRIK